MAKERKDTEEFEYSRWIKHWIIDDTPFHSTKTDPILVEKADEIFEGTVNKVFVPLCGKSLDMIWMYNKGFTVVGVDIAEKPLVDFCTEHRLQVVTETIQNVGKLFKTLDGRIQLYKADIFALSVERLGTFDVIWDLAGYPVIHFEDRRRYFELMKSLLKPHSKYYIMGPDFDSSVYSGPPKSTNKKELLESCGDIFSIEDVHEMDMRKAHGPLQKRLPISVEENSRTSTDGIERLLVRARDLAKSPYLIIRYFYLRLK